ncbi:MULTISPECIES: hypothetical protein [Nocardia]|uniref:hypothetical protein n=1 Tax=Nocardia TaxID=1817 RepID=UPI0004C44B09|nr:MULTISPECIES: hypothetical protein [Nocardia]MBF6145944.1 hypothetical protein [Nocardia nova]
MRYRLGVVAPTVTEVVRCAGGWLFDRGMAGWEVTVIVNDPTHARALEILGAVVLDMEDSLSSPVHSPHPHAVALAGELFETDHRIRCGVLDTLDRGLSEVTLLGEFCPDELDCRVDTVQHRLSVAARAFKRQALAAAGIPATSVAPLETFRSGAPVWAPPVDLVPVAG